jgi:hypothetical protein
MLENYIKPIKKYLNNALDSLKLELDKEINNTFNNLEI